MHDYLFTMTTITTTTHRCLEGSETDWENGPNSTRFRTKSKIIMWQYYWLIWPHIQYDQSMVSKWHNPGLILQYHCLVAAMWPWKQCNNCIFHHDNGWSYHSYKIPCYTTNMWRFCIMLPVDYLWTVYWSKINHLDWILDVVLIIIQQLYHYNLNVPCNVKNYLTKKLKNVLYLPHKIIFGEWCHVTDIICWLCIWSLWFRVSFVCWIHAHLYETYVAPTLLAINSEQYKKQK